VIPETYCAKVADAGALELDELDEDAEDDPPLEEVSLDEAGGEETDADAGIVGGVGAGDDVTAGTGGGGAKMCEISIGALGRVVGPTIDLVNGLFAASITVSSLPCWREPSLQQ
jgi:hypothetical protein